MRKPSVKSRLLTLQELERIQNNPSLAHTAGQSIPLNHPTLQFTRHAAIGLATTQPKKFTEMILPLENQNKNIKVVNAMEWLRWWLSADEISKSYLGNAYEKAESLMDRVYDLIGYEKFMAQMKERGLNPDNFAFIVNDTGSSMSMDYSPEHEFKKSRHEASPGSWPGVETGPIYDAQGGVPAFHSALKRLKTRFGKEGKVYDDSGWDEVTYLLFKPTPRRQDIQILSFEARVPIRYHTQPGKNTSGDVLTSHDFLSLDMDGLPDHIRAHRIAEFRDDYFRQHSPMAYAMREMINYIDVPLKFTPAFSRAAQKEKPVVIATQANLISAQNGAHELPLVEGAVCQTTHYPDNNGAVDSLCQFSDGIVLTPHSDAVLQNWDHHFLDLMDMWSSLIVSKQVCVEQFFGKPLIVMNDKKNFSYKEVFNGDLDWDDPNVERAFVDYLGKIDPAKDPWLQFIMLTKYLHEKNFVKQEPHFLYTQMAADTPGIEKIIRDHMLEGRKERIPVPKYQSETYGTDRTDKFEISVMGSAGTRVESYIREAESLGYWAAMQGMHVRTGGGNYGIMGAAARGVLAFMEAYPDKPTHSHLSLIQMPRTLQFEGAAVDPKTIKPDSNIFMAVERDFDDRMESIFRSNIAVAMAPGIGTYQEIIRWLRHKRDGAPHLQGQKIILVNSAQPGSEDGIRLMDPFLKILPGHVLANDITVVPDIEAAKKIIKAAQLAHKDNVHGPFQPVQAVQNVPALRQG